MNITSVTVTPTLWGAVGRSLKAIIGFVTVAASIISTALAVSPTHSLTLYEIGAALLGGIATHQFVYHASNAAPLPVVASPALAPTVAVVDSPIVDPVTADALALAQASADPGVQADNAGRHEAHNDPTAPAPAPTAS